MAKPLSAIKTWAGMTYTYNGSLLPRKRMQINNCYLELEVDVVQKLINDQLKVEDVSEQWLQAQLLLRGSGRPGEELRWTKPDMISRLVQIIPILQDKYYIVSIQIFISISHHPNPSPGRLGAFRRSLPQVRRDLGQSISNNTLRSL